MLLINLTPHSIDIFVGDTKITIPPSGQVARVGQEYQNLGDLHLEDGAAVPLVAATYGEIQGLPEPRPGVLYITSGLVAQAAWAMGRRDVLAPDTGAGGVRDGEGRIIGVRRLLAHPDLRP